MSNDSTNVRKLQANLSFPTLARLYGFALDCRLARSLERHQRVACAQCAVPDVLELGVAQFAALDLSALGFLYGRHLSALTCTQVGVGLH